VRGTVKNAGGGSKRKREVVEEKVAVEPHTKFSTTKIGKMSSRYREKSIPQNGKRKFSAQVRKKEEIERGSPPTRGEYSLRVLEIRIKKKQREDE